MAENTRLKEMATEVKRVSDTLAIHDQQGIATKQQLDRIENTLTSLQRALDSITLAVAKIQNQVKRISPAKMQLRRENGLCFTCDEKYSWNHNCPNKQLMLLMTNPDDTDSSDSFIQPRLAHCLPQDIIADVLRRLSVKDLLRYRSVEKLWCSLIDSSEFVKMHLDYALKTGSGLGLVIKEDDYADSYRMNLDYPYADKDFDCSNSGGHFVLLGSCNGLLVFKINDGCADIFIGNPSTRMYRKLPNPPQIKRPPQFRPYSFDKHVSYGFGYDHVGDDYKLLRLVQYHTYSYAEVYSAKTNCWKRICFPYYLLYCDSPRSSRGAYASNALHWVVYKNYKTPYMMFIVAFDLEKEQFHEVPMPSFEDRPPFHEIYLLGVLGGSLCAVCNSLIPVSDELSYMSELDSEFLDVWMMKEYSVKESWTVLFYILPTEQTGTFKYMRPVGYLRALGNDRILFDQDGKKSIMYDLAGEMVEDADFFEPSCHTDSIACVEVWLDLMSLKDIVAGKN